MNLTNKNYNVFAFSIKQKQLILTVLVLAFTCLGFAQKRMVAETIFSPAIQNSIEVLRITDDMSIEDIELELINNFYKLELSDIVIGSATQLTRAGEMSKTDQFFEDVSVNTNYKVISDVAVRTTGEMRSSVYSADITSA